MNIRRVGSESTKSYLNKINTGFFEKYLSGSNILDIGYKGGDPEALPIVEQAIGVDRDFPNYDGSRLPFPDESQDAIYSSHCLEHIANYKAVLIDWYRVTRIGGYIIIIVPHKYLYEKKAALPTQWGGDHQRFYTPASLLKEIEDTLPINGFRIRHLADNDLNFDYSLPANQHSTGCYEIELVLEKIARPEYSDQLYSPSDCEQNLSNALNIIKFLTGKLNDTGRALTELGLSINTTSEQVEKSIWGNKK